MAIALRGTPTTATRSTAGTLTVNVPAGIQANDVILIGIDVAGGSNVPATPAGLTKLDSNSNGPSTVTFWRLCDGSETSFAFTTASAAAGQCRAYSGCDTTTPINVHAALNRLTSTTSATATTITTTVDGCMIVMFAGSNVNQSTFTVPSGFANKIGPSSGSTTSAIVGCDLAQTNAGATGDETGTFGTSGSTISGLIALAPLVVNGNASGSIPALTESSPAASAAGGGGATGAVGTLTLSVVAGTASGSASTTKPLGTLTFSSPLGTAASTAVATGTLASLVLSAVTGAAASVVIYVGGTTIGGRVARIIPGRAMQPSAGRPARRTP